MRRLGITRQLNQLRELIAKAASRNIEVVPIPVSVSEPLPFEWPSQLLPSGPDWVLFTSANGVDAFFDQVLELGIELNPHTRYGVVGEKTGRALRDHGFAPSFMPTESYGEYLFEQFIEMAWKPGESVMYARGLDISYDPTEMFEARQMPYYPVVCYRSIDQALEPQLMDTFTENDYILFTAPSTVRAYHNQYGQPRARVIAIGHTTGAEMTKAGWLGFSWLPKPDVELVLEYF